MNKPMNSKELTKAIKASQPRGTFVDARTFTNLITYGASFHVREDKWSDSIATDVMNIIMGTHYQMSVTHGNCMVKNGQLIDTVSIDITVIGR